MEFLDQFVVIPTKSKYNGTANETVCHLQQSSRDAYVDVNGNEVEAIEAKNVTLMLSSFPQSIIDKANALFVEVIEYSKTV